MAIWTAQYRYSGADRMDITAKASMLFSPDWPMVDAYKKAEKAASETWNMKEAEIIMTTAKNFYRHTYLYCVDSKIATNYESFRTFITYAMEHDVTFVCYCNVKKTNFCHRILVAEYLRDRYGLIYKGERG